MNPKNDFKCASCNCQSGCSTKRCYCKRMNAKCLSKCHGGKSCTNQPAESEQIKAKECNQQEQIDGGEVSKQLKYCKYVSKVYAR